MNREIKFRAWDKELKMMDYDFYIHSSGEQYQLATRNYNTPHIEIEPCNLILMQYAVLKDMNGIDIYEGDLVQIEGMFHDKLFKVWFGCGVFYIGNWNVQEFIKAFDFYKVVGNIYENPEFLQEGN